MQRTYACFTLRQGLVMYPRPVALLLPQLLKCLLGIPCPGSSFIFNHKCRILLEIQVFVILFNPTRQPLTLQQKGLTFTKLNKSICSWTIKNRINEGYLWIVCEGVSRETFSREGKRTWNVMTSPCSGREFCT